MTNKLFAVGGGVLTALAILYMGNLTVTTTPQTIAKETYQYKFTKLGCDVVMSENWQCVEDAVNSEASNGWRLVSTDGQSFMVDLAIFEKEQ